MLPTQDPSVFNTFAASEVQNPFARFGLQVPLLLLVTSSGFLWIWRWFAGIISLGFLSVWFAVCTSSGFPWGSHFLGFLGVPFVYDFSL